MATFNSALGLAIDEAGQVTLETRPEHEVIPGTIHFAVLTTIGEVAAAQSVGAAVVPASVHVDCVRRARPGSLVGRGELVRRGGRLAFARGTVSQGEEVVAVVTVTFALLG